MFLQSTKRYNMQKKTTLLYNTYKTWNPESAKYGNEKEIHKKKHTQKKKEEKIVENQSCLINRACTDKPAFEFYTT